jgi:hypothetical protein
MKLHQSVLTVITLSATILCLAGTAPQPQQQEEFKAQNLKVLPNDISKAKLDTVMQNWKNALGVKCGHCHSPSKERPGKLDFASDAKPEKNIARTMYKMTRQLNKKYFDAHSASVNRISCNTCHRGENEPKDQFTASQ